MKNVTLSAPEPLIEAARKWARAQNTTPNAEFRRWLESYSQRATSADRVLSVMDRVGKYASSGKVKFTRDQMNER